ncbi:glycosyltransferase family 10 domain-containing protein [Marinospirillum minutulum]|uniref:glycosyltransferase family 10 domain-containing protein n=1 Tax=Marinospirillum minutulum TaxID=64974 RepID=UPI000424E22C|nr:glycosyltransferase family 10 [Marinospirillum minutulum]
MKKACLVVDSFYDKNKIFDLNDKIRNRDNCLYQFHMLKDKFSEHGIDLSTSDINSIKESDIVIYNEMPKCLPKCEDKEKSHLILFESELIRPDNWDKNKFNRFNKIFTWNDELVDNHKFFKINFCYNPPKEINAKFAAKEKFCTLISGNKKVNHPWELYSKRIEAIRWFEKNNPDQFDLYGVGWDKYRFHGPKLIRALNRFQFLTSVLSESYPSYKGKVDSKKAILEKYKFAICFENAQSIPGYVTEKIFDCFFAGCIPIYWGASNIKDHVPQDCFIDFREFESYENLYQYLSEMSENEFDQRIDSIQKFLSSSSFDQFKAETFAQTILDKIIEQ